MSNNNQNRDNGRNRSFQSRGGGSNFNRQDNNSNNSNFRNNRDGGQFGQGGRGGRGDRGGRGGARGNRGDRGGRGRGRGDYSSYGENRGRQNFNNENGNDGQRFSQNQSDYSKSRSRDKSSFRQGPYGGMKEKTNNYQNEGDDMDDNKQGKGGYNQRAGDWRCPDAECDNINFSIRSQCNRCGIDKPEELVQMELERKNNAPEFKKGDWNCPCCKNLNFARRDTCNRCNLDRPEDTYEGYKPGKNPAQNNEFEGEDENQNNRYEEGEVNEERDFEQQGNLGGNEVEEGEVGGW